MRALLIGILAGWLAGCAAVPEPGPVPVGEAKLYVVGRGWHTDVGFSVEEVSGPLTSLELGFPGVRYLVFGFGERAYYMQRNEGSGDMLGALFPSKSAILVTALTASPTEAFPGHDVVILQLPPTDLERIVTRLWDDLEKSPDGSAVRLADGPYVGSAFYASNETYDGFHTCNTWTALLLRQAGFPMNPHVLFADQVMRQVHTMAARQAAAAR
ncbi:MAG TPA: DUF2459 domain-containing protein [Acetobacteraceae bacterium]|nr:DUF2459 domain-containing protein [Acetobacteraceae bacterium]